MKNRFTIGLIVLLVIIILMGGFNAVLAVVSLSQSGQAIDRTEAAEDARDQARLIACDAFNDQQQRSIDGAVETIATNNHTILGSVFDHLTPEQEQQLEQLYAKASADTKATAVDSYPLRDCSPAGIAAYYHDQPGG